MITCKATLIDVGTGMLEFAEDTLSFYIEKGLISKRREYLREINVADIESLRRSGDEVSVSWRGARVMTDLFIIKDSESLTTVYAAMTESWNKYKRTVEEKGKAKQKRNEIVKILTAALGISNDLFDILRSLHGRVDWIRLERYLKSSEEKFAQFKVTSTSTTSLDVTRLSSAVSSRLPEEVIKEAYDIIREMYEYFTELAETKDTFLQELHPNYRDAKAVISAHYLLNDIVLGAVIGDEKIESQIADFAAMVQDLSKQTNSKINVNGVMDTIKTLVAEKGKESLVDDSRKVFMEQIKELIA